MDAKKYNNIKLAVGITEGILTFIILLLFVALGYSKLLTDYLSRYTVNSYLLLILFTLVLGVAGTILSFPLNYYVEFYLEHKYNLSNQTFWRWIWENTKAALVSSVIGFPILLFFYYVLVKFGELWWLPFAIILFILSVVLAKIVPIIILPLFYKVTPIDDDDLKSRIKKLAKGANLKIENVFRFNMSKNTKKANAAFTGLGKTKRIILGDTLLEKFSNDEIETVLAHEFGHYKKKHIIKNIIIGTLFSFLTLYLIALLYDVSLSWFGFVHRTEIAALPILALWGMIIGLITTPITNIISRKFEHEADEYAVVTTGKKEIFIKTLDKLTDQNLGDKEPHPFVEWFFYSHPSIKKRTEYISNL
jgi:STE24 endopeptidase